LQAFEKIEKLFPDAKTELKNWKMPFQFLVCIILSAQTTDKQVNKITKDLFKHLTTVKDFANADAKDVAQYINSINYYNSKARYIVGSAKKVMSDFGGNVPKNISQLVTLPGVGYKTANVFLNEMYQANQGIAVDTHVARVAKRLGWTTNKDPNKIAKDLEAIFPQEIWYKVNTVLVLFGRYFCTARAPKCNICPLSNICGFYND